MAYRSVIFYLGLLTAMSGCAAGQAQPERESPVGVFAYDCGALEAVLEYAEDGRVRLLTGKVSLPLTAALSASGARYVGPGYVFWSKGDSAVLETPGASHACRYDRMASIWAAARLRGVVFRAVGNEPGWVLEIDGEGIALQLDYGLRQLRFAPLPARADSPAGLVVYNAIDGETRLAVRIAERTCQDSMADLVYPASVTVVVDEQTYQGCGRYLAEPER